MIRCGCGYFSKLTKVQYCTLRTEYMCLIGEAQLPSQYIARMPTFLCGWPCIQRCIGGQSLHLEGSSGAWARCHRWCYRWGRGCSYHLDHSHLRYKIKRFFFLPPPPLDISCLFCLLCYISYSWSLTFTSLIRHYISYLNSTFAQTMLGHISPIVNACIWPIMLQVNLS